MENIKYNVNTRVEVESFVEYAIELDDEYQTNEAARRYSGFFRKVSSLFGIVNYKNYVGEADFLGMKFNVKSKKISNKDYEQMLFEIGDAMAELPFSFNSPTYEVFDINEEVDSELAEYQVNSSTEEINMVQINLNEEEFGKY